MPLPLWISVQFSILAFVVVTWYVYSYKGISRALRTKPSHFDEEEDEDEGVYYDEEDEEDELYYVREVSAPYYGRPVYRNAPLPERTAQPLRYSSSMPRTLNPQRKGGAPPLPQTMLQPPRQQKHPLMRDYMGLNKDTS